MSHVTSARLYSFGVVIGCDMNTEVIVMVGIPCRIKSEDTAFFFTNQELLQHGVRDFSSLKEIAIQEAVHVGRYHSNDSRLIVSKCEQSRQNFGSMRI